jgi:hypothetical protein
LAARALALVICLGLGLLAALAGPAFGREEAWKVAIRGQDVTRAADPLLAGGVLLVDAVALGPSLPLRVRAAGREVTLLDASGLEWRGTAGDSRLSAPGRSLSLDRPVRIDGPSVHLPAKVVAELAGLRLDLDPGTRTAAFADRDGPPAAAPAGWQSLVLPKPADPAGGGAPPPRRRQDVFLPPDHDTLRVGLGLGVVPGADGGGELTAAGSVRGIDTALSLLATTGPRGFDLQSGHAALTDPVRGLGLEAGDLFSGLWGLTRGARFRWRRGEEGASWPTLSVYLGDPAANPRTVIAWGDEIGLGRWGTAAGELASDGSWLASGRFRRDRLSLSGHLRNASGLFGEGRSAGLSGSFDLPWGAELQGVLSRSGSGGRRLDGRTLSLRLPLRPGSDLTLATDRSENGRSRGRIDSIEGTAARGRFQLRGRWQWREIDFPGLLPGASQRFAERGLFTSASWLAGSRLRLEAQLVERWPESGRRDEWRQVSAAFALSRRTSLQVFATSSSSGFGDTFRIRLDQEIRPGFSLFAEAGDVVTFQGVTSLGGADRSRVRIMVRRSWDVAAPAAGSGVEGVVQGPGALAMAGLPVELGPYRTVTGGDGRYAFPNVPPGTYDLRLREQGLPADLATGPPARVQVKRGESRRADLSLVPLGEARGAVWTDRNGNHRRDPGEGIAGVVLILDDRATSTIADGSFGFFNLTPGAHRLRVATDRLPAGLQAQVPSRMDLGLPPGQSIEGLDFQLREKMKPVVFQEGKR